MSTKRQYPPQFRSEAVRQVRKSGKPINQIADDLGIAHQTLRNWIQQAEIDTRQREGLTTAEREERLSQVP